MAADNKTLGRFELTDIPPAPRGVPQVEVTFDIDANGIVNVSAKDLGTGKEQSIRITASSGLSEDEVENLVKEAEAHAEEDKKKKKLIEVRNQADTLIYTTEKSIRDLGDKLDSVTKGEIENKIETLKKTLEGDDAEAIERDMNDLAQASHKLAEQLYAQKSEQPGPEAGAQPGPEAGAEAGQQAGGKDDEDVVDADYKEV
jgi:molecular chaperone DnaK